jgi:bifunctional NMN adenylyltransferase/nudix hydrolase
MTETRAPQTLLFIGRFQPFHIGHMQLVMEGLRRAERLVIGLGSSGVVNEKNFLGDGQRMVCIIDSLPLHLRSRVSFIALTDYPQSDQDWANQVRRHMKDRGEWGLFGRNKDASTFYLKLFPEVPLVEAKGPFLPLDATVVRNMFRCKDYDFMPAIKHLVPIGTACVLERIRWYELAGAK